MATSHAQRGSGIVEFSLASSVLCFVLIAIMAFGNALYVYNLVANAARLGARYAIVRGSMCTFSGCPATSASIQTYVRSVSPNIDSALLTVTTGWGAAGACKTSPYQGPGCLVTVTASYPLQTFGPFRTMTMSSTSKMYVSR